MELVRIYEEYTALNGQYAAFLEQLIGAEEMVKDEAVLSELGKTKDQLEALMAQSSGLEIDGANEQNLNDLKYLVTDVYFLAMDLEHFYKHNEMGRFKMRVLNYLNKKRRAEAFQ